MELIATPRYLDLLAQISQTYTQGRLQAVQAVNTRIQQTYWQVGRQIVEFEQDGKSKAEYGKALINNLAGDLCLHHGKGFSRSNLIRFRQFYLAWPIGATLSHQLGWLWPAARHVSRLWHRAARRCQAIRSYLQLPR